MQGCRLRDTYSRSSTVMVTIRKVAIIDMRAISITTLKIIITISTNFKLLVYCICYASQTVTVYEIKWNKESYYTFPVRGNVQGNEIFYNRRVQPEIFVGFSFCYCLLSFRCPITCRSLRMLHEVTDPFMRWII